MGYSARCALGTLLRRTVECWWEDNAMRLGAALAYYTVFSLAPFLIVVIAVAGLVVDSAYAERQIVDQIAHLIGPDGGQAVAALLSSARQPGAGRFAALTSLVTIVIGATAVFSELQSGLNGIWRVPAGGRHHARPPGTHALLPIVIGAGFLLVVSLVAHASPGGANLAREHPPSRRMRRDPHERAHVRDDLQGAPDTPVAWRDVGVGALVTAVLFAVGQWGLARYLGTSSVASVYGAAGSLVVILVWVYYSAQVFFLGAEFTHAYAPTVGSRAGAYEREREGASAPPSARLSKAD
jgi:membrane protein